MLALALLGLGLSTAGACSSSSGTSQKNAVTARDASEAGDAAVPDAACDESGAYPDACRSGCRNSLADACPTPDSCVMDWPSDVHAFCSMHPLDAVLVGFAQTCGPYHALKAYGPEFVLKYYFSSTTGKLVAVVYHQPLYDPPKCFGGPSGFVEPHCNFVGLSCSDAGGLDGGRSGGVDAAP